MEKICAVHFFALILDFGSHTVYNLRKPTKKCKAIVLIKRSFSLKKLDTAFSVISMKQRNSEEKTIMLI